MQKKNEYFHGQATTGGYPAIGLDPKNLGAINLIIYSSNVIPYEIY